MEVLKAIQKCIMSANLCGKHALRIGVASWRCKLALQVDQCNTTFGDRWSFVAGLAAQVAVMADRTSISARFVQGKREDVMTTLLTY